MSDQAEAPFLEFLRAGVAKGGFAPDDVLAALLPLLRQTQRVHETGKVAPLDGIGGLAVSDQGWVTFQPAEGIEPKKNSAKVEELQTAPSAAVDLAGEVRAADVAGGGGAADRANHELARPRFLPGYLSWEHAAGHHDQLTDIFSLGLLLASVACGLDFTRPADAELFATHRANLFAIRPRLNPVMVSVIVQMTELNRHKRAPDLAQVISRLANYRDQALEIDFEQVAGFKESSLTGKRRMIQSRLRDRLFEISRRNRLIYFRSTQGSLNLTVASVPLLLDYRNIKLEQLFVWQPELAERIASGGSISLGKYLRFEDAPYIAPVLDKIISEARRDRNEYGFAQLRLVLCFLRWNNLKEAPEERIHSPLLLLPVELTRKRGVRDSYVLEPGTSEAEVNPSLRHHLRALYNLELPEWIDLKETSLEQFCDLLRARIQASEPGVTLNKIDRPRIELIHETARQRVEQYQRRAHARTGKQSARVKPDLDTEPAAPPNAEETPAAAALPKTERQLYAVRTAENQNPYAWDFDLCSLTLGNFNYRKMTLVRDFANLIETDLASPAFDTVFSLSPKPIDEPPPTLELAEQHLIVACDSAQLSAIARARRGSSYIIQGPPGTGKSQTITNLIADYVARGKRVLFVCEKRAAIDVVFQRLRQQGLDELCCLIHDSQTDKKAFVQNLRQTYEKFLDSSDPDGNLKKNRAAKLRAMEEDLATLRQFSEVMRQPHPNTGLAVRTLLHRMAELRGATGAPVLSPEREEMLPEYPLWLSHGGVVERLHAALADLGQELCFARHPLRWLGHEVLRADRPIELMSKLVDDAEERLEEVERALASSGLSPELWDSFEEIQAILDFASRAHFLAERAMLDVLTRPAASGFEKLQAEIEAKVEAVAQAKQKAGAWKEPLTPDDTENALALAEAFERSFFRIFQPAYWRLKKTLQARYDFGQHAVVPAWSKILKDLAALHTANAALNSARAAARKEWRTGDDEAFRQEIQNLRGDHLMAHPSVQELVRHLAGAPEGGALVQKLAGIERRFDELDRTLRSLLGGHEELDFHALTQLLSDLRGLSSIVAELSPVLGELADLPGVFGHALRRVEIPLPEFEPAIGQKSLNLVYRQDRALNRFDSRVLARKIEQLEKRYREWLDLNASSLRASVREKFVESANLSALPASQLAPEQKEFKKSYSAGRRELEHEFGKTMRHKSIRDLAAGDTGRVVQDLKPIWLMSPLSVSDTLPLEPNLFDVVIFDEASQIPLEEAIPALYRAPQVIIVGDEMQLPPTAFFATARSGESVLVEDEGERVEVDLDADSFLTQSARNLPSTLLAWHYRSRSESLISFSNAAFYSGNLLTIPDRQREPESRPEIKVTGAEQGESNVPALLARSISFHFMEQGVYDDRINPNEAEYIARLVQGLLRAGNGLSIGVVAFSEAQQTEIENALNRLAEEDSDFSARLEAEYVREENDVFCGLFVKNLENVQGDERDIIIMSVCYGPDPKGRVLMNFGPINQRGGEKRLNVIFSRAKRHMAVVSSMRHHQITNDYNDGANSLKQFLQYAEAVSIGSAAAARRVLENLNPLAKKALAPLNQNDAVVNALADVLRARGHSVDLNVGQSRFRCDLAVRTESDGDYRLGILVDTENHYENPNLIDRYLLQPTVLRAFGWRIAMVLTKDWHENPGEVLARIEKLLAESKR